MQRVMINNNFIANKNISHKKYYEIYNYFIYYQTKKCYTIKLGNIIYVNN